MRLGRRRPRRRRSTFVPGIAVIEGCAGGRPLLLDRHPRAPCAPCRRSSSRHLDFRARSGSDQPRTGRTSARARTAQGAMDMPRHSHAIIAGLALAALTAARAHAQGARCFMLNDPDPEDGGRFGQHVQIVDLNGDGLGELVIGAPGKTVAGNSAAGQVLIKVGPVEPGNAGWVVVTQPHSVPACSIRIRGRTTGSAPGS
ncbi:MAG: FG-GAP repeat protein [Planctomycetota bacterium]